MAAGQEVALDEDGAPVVCAFRSDDGRLTFRYLTVRPGGGMAVWLPVGDEIQRAIASGETPAGDKLRHAALLLAGQMSQVDVERVHKLEELTELSDAQDVELAELRQQLAASEAERERLRGELDKREANRQSRQRRQERKQQEGAAAA